MNLPYRIRHAGLLLGALALVVACGPPTSGGSTTPAGQAKSAADVGGVSALETLAKKEGQLNVIALPRDWANYGAVLDAFKAKYGIAITSDKPRREFVQGVKVSYPANTPGDVVTVSGRDDGKTELQVVDDLKKLNSRG